SGKGARKMPGLTLFQALTLLLLFVFVYTSVRFAAQAIWEAYRMRSRLGDKEWAASDLKTSGTLQAKWLLHISSLLESLRVNMTVRQWTGASLVLLLAGAWLGAALFTTVKGMMILGAMLGSCPYLWLRFRLLSLQMKTRLEFLPAVEV